MTDNGYIYLWRKILDSAFYTNANACHLAIHCILKANFKDKKMVFNKEEMIIKRGTFVTGLHALKKETGLSYQKLRTAFDTLENIGFISRKVTNRFSIVSVCKYDTYQNPDNQITIKQQSNNNQITTTNKDKEGKEYNICDKAPTKSVGKSQLESVISFYGEKTGVTFKEKNKTYWEFFKINCSPAKKLLEVCETAERAKEAIIGISTVLVDRGMSWSLYAIVKWYVHWDAKGNKFLENNKPKPKERCDF